MANRVACNPRVVRVETANGSHIEPQLDQEWSNLDKLRWHLAVCLHDAGADPELMHVEPGNMTINGRAVEAYQLLHPCGTFGGGGFHEMWDLINGVQIGLSNA
jgi:hypothetical protein